MIRHLSAILMVAVSILATAGAKAQEYKLQAPNDQEGRDAQIVWRAMTSPLADRIAMAQVLADVIARAPAAYPMRETIDGITYLRTVPNREGGLPSTGGAAATNGAAATAKTAYSLNTYPMAAFLLGSDAVEAGRPDVAIAWLDKGLALQPTFLTLVNEKATALHALGRPSESLPMLERALADSQQAGDIDGRARAMRAQGWALIELKRLDEAEKVFRQSLVLAPGNCMALTELGYIAQVRERADLTSAPSQVKTSEEAAKGCNQT